MRKNREMEINVKLAMFRDTRELFPFFFSLLRYGGAEGARTPGLRIANASLSQLSYSPMVIF